MDITLEDIGRRFNRDWIFRHVNYRFVSGQRYAILGPNGSGKSTLLQVIASSLTPSAGRIRYVVGGVNVDADDLFRHVSLAAPYLELIEEFTLTEQLRFHFNHKDYRDGFDQRSVMEVLGLARAEDRPLKYFSSGMKQRVKLALACCADTAILLLDEPTTNLDQAGVDWYLDLVERTASGRLVMVCSNQEREYAFCEHALMVTDYKA